ncbi:MAG: RNA polymerase factor sigma-32 [Magnetococcales bacterium]|nr:RNA polymerase factor sigma-32 [Magnetococcales bacterium]MBF0149867.1 RNA polymerase factor sigma-32 [Magnetococcales bacterium]MBF0174676.1 RNA polymerase factor sigma-32 [Magnetococcales bacterium]MBF0346520.1 RNA polymerase factor sigma-32 [Magnetococcales bacterium]MBF0631841.1 RNA polymerase factor sigma-32 [Magnetococcales bacterium]
MTTFPVTLSRMPELVVAEDNTGLKKLWLQAMQAPLLSSEEEYDLAKRYRDHNDLEAAHKLVHAYLRLVLKTAREYVNYRLNLADLVQEGTVGLMHAVKKFDPDRGNRLSSYAIWWIRAAIHDYILRSWRMVRIATTQLKRKLFFKLRQAKSSLAPLSQDEAEELAIKFNTDAKTILDVDHRMSGADTSLNQSMFEDSGEIIDLIADERPDQEHLLSDRQQEQFRMSMIRQGLEQLSERERHIVSRRFLADKQDTLENLAQHHAISRERVRQIENRAMEKLRNFFNSVPESRDMIFEH